MKFSTERNNIYFLSDFHLGHKNAILFDNRPFANVDEMNEYIFALIDNFDKNDIVFYLGDFAWNKQVAIEALSHIKNTWYFIRGNHEKPLSQTKTHMYDLLDIIVDGQPITLCHYPMISWNKSHFGAWMLHGHHHSDTSNHPAFSYGKILNVFFGNFDYKPVSFSQVKDIMETRNDNWSLIRHANNR